MYIFLVLIMRHVLQVPDAQLYIEFWYILLLIGLIKVWLDTKRMELTISKSVVFHKDNTILLS